MAKWFVCCARPAVVGEPAGAGSARAARASSASGALHTTREQDRKLSRETLFSLPEVEALRTMHEAAANTIHVDGLMHRDEFKQALFKGAAGGGPASSNSPGAPLAAVDEVEAHHAGRKPLSNGKGNGRLSNGRPGSARADSRGTKSLFADRVFDLLDSKSEGTLSFDAFVRGLQVFHPRADQESKSEFLFSVYDLKGNGVIEPDEVRSMLKGLVQEKSGLTLPMEAMDSLVDETFEQADLARDGVIHMEEWKQVRALRLRPHARMTPAPNI